MALATNSIESLFDNSNNPTRLVPPSGGVAIADAINTADNNLSQVKMMDPVPNDAQRLSQLLGFAKGLQMLQPYFTDLTMATPASSGQAGPDLSATNSSINELGISNPAYLQILYGLTASVSNTTQSNQLLHLFFNSLQRVALRS